MDLEEVGERELVEALEEDGEDEDAIEGSRLD